MNSIFRLPSEPEAQPVDIVNQATRSRMMARIRGANTKPEMIVRRELHALGFRFRIHVRDLSGRPDIVLAKFKAVVFVNGCFWHAHEGCELFKFPSTRTDFWREKLLANRQRDARNIFQLQEGGWRVATIWECSLNRDKLTAKKLANWLPSASRQIELPELHRRLSSGQAR